MHFFAKSRRASCNRLSISCVDRARRVTRVRSGRRARGVVLPFAVSRADGYAELHLDGNVDGCASLAKAAHANFDPQCASTDKALQEKVGRVIADWSDRKHADPFQPAHFMGIHEMLAKVTQKIKEYDFLYKNNIAIYKGKKHLEKNIIQIAIYNKTKDDIDLLVDLL